jgi:hypothetical protein
MKLVKVLSLSVAVCAFALMGVSTVRAADEKKACCEATVEAGKKCDHKCCQTAAEKGKVCKKCHKAEEKK